ncbi:hypothetical protein ABPG75_011381 [Micractinium tetrahymenae]
MEALFRARYASVTSATMQEVRMHRCPGVLGFVGFASDEERQRALREMNGHELPGGHRMGTGLSTTGSLHAAPSIPSGPAALAGHAASAGPSLPAAGATAAAGSRLGLPAAGAAAVPPAAPPTGATTSAAPAAAPAAGAADPPPVPPAAAGAATTATSAPTATGAQIEGTAPAPRGPGGAPSQVPLVRMPKPGSAKQQAAGMPTAAGPAAAGPGTAAPRPAAEPARPAPPPPPAAVAQAQLQGRMQLQAQVQMQQMLAAQQLYTAVQPGMLPAGALWTTAASHMVRMPTVLQPAGFIMAPTGSIPVLDPLQAPLCVAGGATSGLQLSLGRGRTAAGPCRCHHQAQCCSRSTAASLRGILSPRCRGRSAGKATTAAQHPQWQHQMALMGVAVAAAVAPDLPPLSTAGTTRADGSAAAALAGNGAVAGAAAAALAGSGASAGAALAASRSAAWRIPHVITRLARGGTAQQLAARHPCRGRRCPCRPCRHGCLPCCVPPSRPSPSPGSSPSLPACCCRHWTSCAASATACAAPGCPCATCATF